MDGDASVLVDGLRADPELEPGRLIDVLVSLVRTESVNPGVYEQAMGERVAEWLKGTRAELHYVESLPGRHSIAAVLRGSGDGPTLVLNGHMDTVPIDDPALWSVEPFGGAVRDGFVWGRGSCDMKSGLTVAIAVARYLAARREQLRGTLICQFAIGEERAEPGTLSLCQAGFVGDVGIVLEPTELKVATAARGAAALTIRIKGRSIHASQAHLGVNPNWKLPAVLEALEDYAGEVAARSHAMLPPPSCVPTMIRSGAKPNAVPDRCDVLVDRRFLPGETIEQERALLERRLAQIRESDPEFEFEVIASKRSLASAEISADSAFARQVADAVGEVTGTLGEIYGTPFASDVGVFVNDAEMEAITFGPGNIAECHCPDERVSVEQLTDATLVTAKVATDLLT